MSKDGLISLFFFLSYAGCPEASTTFIIFLFALYPTLRTLFTGAFDHLFVFHLTALSPPFNDLFIGRYSKFLIEYVYVQQKWDPTAAEWPFLQYYGVLECFLRYCK